MAVRRESPAVGESARDAEIGHHRAARLLVDDDVVGLDVAVNYVAMVCVCERIRHFAENSTHFDRRHRPRLLEAHAEVVALDVRHHEVDEIVFLFDGVDRDDVRVIQLRGRLGFAEESLADVGTKAQFGWQHLHRDLALETFVSRTIHDPHTPATDLAL